MMSYSRPPIDVVQNINPAYTIANSRKSTTDLSPAGARKNPNFTQLQPAKPRRNLFEDDYDSELSSVMNMNPSQSGFSRAEKDMISPSPSQNLPFGGGFYGQTTGFQRPAPLGAAAQMAFNRVPMGSNANRAMPGHVTPTTSALSQPTSTGFPFPQSVSSIGALSPNRSLLSQGNVFGGLNNMSSLLKELPGSSAFSSTNRLTPTLLTVQHQSSSLPKVLNPGFPSSSSTSSFNLGRTMVGPTSAGHTSIAGSLGAFSVANGGSSSPIPPLDPSEFPSLSALRSHQPSMRQGSNSSSGPQSRTWTNFGTRMVGQAPSESQPEFQIQQEDFPALPGSQGSVLMRRMMLMSAGLEATLGFSVPSGLGDGERSASSGGSGDTGRHGMERAGSESGIQIHNDGRVSNIPAGMVTDQFGIVGLLAFLKGCRSRQEIKAISQGRDLTSLGFNLNASENLYNSFLSPWSDTPCRPQDIDMSVPPEYIVGPMIKQKLIPPKIENFNDDILFYLFYTSCGDLLQLIAARELHRRDWRYHKEEKCWIARAPDCEPLQKTQTFERGTYYVFDVSHWQKVKREMYLEYDKLEQAAVDVDALLPLLPVFRKAAMAKPVPEQTMPWEYST